MPHQNFFLFLLFRNLEFVPIYVSVVMIPNRIREKFFIVPGFLVFTKTLSKTLIQIHCILEPARKVNKGCGILMTFHFHITPFRVGKIKRRVEISRLIVILLSFWIIGETCFFSFVFLLTKIQIKMLTWEWICLSNPSVMIALRCQC